MRFAVLAVLERSFMSDKPIKLNWNLFKIVRREANTDDLFANADLDAADACPRENAEPLPSVRRTPVPGEPLAYCMKCREWTPMRWRPKSERGKRAEQWFQCEYCGGRDLTLRYLSPNDAMRRQ